MCEANEKKMETNGIYIIAAQFQFSFAITYVPIKLSVINKININKNAYFPTFCTSNKCFMCCVLCFAMRVNLIHEQ